MEALRLLGVPARDMYLTTGHLGAGRSRESAALLVRTGEEFWLLSERTEQVIAAGHGGEHASFAPIVTYGVGRTWVHGKLVRTAPPVARPPELASTTAAASPSLSKLPR